MSVKSSMMADVDACAFSWAWCAEKGFDEMAIGDWGGVALAAAFFGFLLANGFHELAWPSSSCWAFFLS